MFEKLQEVQARYHELNSQLADPSVTSDPDAYQRLAKEHARLRKLVESYERFRAIDDEIAETRAMLDDDEEAIREMARDELAELSAEREALEGAIKEMLIPRDPLDEKNVILEVRAGTGGEEAALFAADLLRMYERYAQSRGWRVDLVDFNPTDHGGFREVIALIDGDDVYSRLKYEAGVHRVQRVPQTESQGRIHTSAVTVAVLPEADDVEFDLDMNDVRVDTYRSSGAGGQHVNKTESAVRLTHEPTGVVVQCQDETSQHKNKSKAIKMLKTRLLDREREAARSERAAERRDQVGSGDRSERIRTYNFPQSRITDHRIHFTTHQLDAVLEGDLDEVLEPVHAHFRAEALKEATAT
jgi:peptide chain release factor 1